MYDNIADEIKSRCNIVDVIGRIVSLKKMGSNYKGICPFHNEKTPSFVVSETKQIFTCFGCGATGDVIAFVERYYNLDFQGAAEKLANEYGIQIQKKASSTESKRAVLYEINREAATFFYRRFRTKNNVAYEYMHKRGIADETLKTFGIGYADEQWDSLYRHFQQKGTDVKYLIELGLVSDSKGKYFDKFRNRVMFPIINTRGKVIGFGGRAIGEGTPKYLNSSESTVFQKKNNLYGLNLTRQEISKENQAILVEGYMDVISLYQHGIRNVSASLGTALTENQATMLKRYTDHIILSYDADNAGQTAALRGLDILQHSGCKAKVLHITDGKDPDEFVKKNGREAFSELIGQALSFADYKIALLKKQHDLKTTEGSVAFLQETAKVLRDLSPVEADIYVKKIAQETKISEGAIRLEIFGNNNNEKGLNQPIPLKQRRTSVKLPTENVPLISMLEKNLIKLMLVKSSFVPKIKQYEEQAFTNVIAKRIYDLILAIYEEGQEIDLKKLEDALEPADNVLLENIMQNIQLADKEEEVFSDCIALIEGRQLDKREKEIIDILSILDEEDSGMSDSERNEYNIEELMKELMEIQRKKNSDGRNRRG